MVYSFLCSNLSEEPKACWGYWKNKKKGEDVIDHRNLIGLYLYLYQLFICVNIFFTFFQITHIYLDTIKY